MTNRKNVLTPQYNEGEWWQSPGKQNLILCGICGSHNSVDEQRPFLGSDAVLAGKYFTYLPVNLV
jgi:hypothetical protein